MGNNITSYENATEHENNDVCEEEMPKLKVLPYAKGNGYSANGLNLDCKYVTETVTRTADNDNDLVNATVITRIPDELACGQLRAALVAEYPSTLVAGCVAAECAVGQPWAALVVAHTAAVVSPVLRENAVADRRVALVVAHSAAAVVGGVEVVAVATLHGEAVKIHKEDLEMSQAIGCHGAELLNDGDKVITHCNTGGRVFWIRCALRSRTCWTASIVTIEGKASRFTDSASK